MCIQHKCIRKCLERATTSSNDLIGPSGCFGGANISDGLYIACPSKYNQSVDIVPEEGGMGVARSHLISSLI